jgi:hypothetical protein
MRLILSLLIIFSTQIAFAQPSKTLNLNLPGSLFYERTPGSNKSIRLTLLDIHPSVWVHASDNNNKNRLSKGQSTLHGKGQRSVLLVFSRLYNFTEAGNLKTFFFGQNGGENDLDQAVIRVSNSGAAATPGKTMNRKSVIIGVSDSEFFSVPASGSPSDDIKNGKLFLNVEASAGKTATIELDREAQRGNVLVAVISQKNGNLLATLNPKDPENQLPKLSFTVDENVIIIPVVRPSASSVNGVDTVVFAVGDPREVATVTVSEE